LPAHTDIGRFVEMMLDPSDGLQASAAMASPALNRDASLAAATSLPAITISATGGGHAGVPTL
jgi:hypothetical protein